MAALLGPAMPHAAKAVIRLGEPWLDSHGRRIQAHGGGLLCGKACTTGLAKTAHRQTILISARLPAIPHAI